MTVIGSSAEGSYLSAMTKLPIQGQSAESVTDVKLLGRHQFLTELVEERLKLGVS